MSDKKRKANCAGSALAVCIVIMAVLILSLIHITVWSIFMRKQ